MRFIKCMVVLSLCLLLGSCPEDKGDLDIDIGDYEGQLAAWNSQNMLDYQIYVGRSSGGGPINARFIVRNGISECTDPSGWGDMFYSTIPEYFSLVKKIEKNLTDEYNNGHKRSLSLRVSYNTEYHYPSKIISISDVSYASRSYSVSLMPFEEGEIEIDIGDYESQLAAWNSQNMLDYRFMVECYCGYYGKKYREEEIYTVRNGVNVKDGPFITSSFINRKNIKTIPEIFSFIKAEEERIGNEYNGIYRSYLTVQYDPNYHYPVQINSRIGHLFGEYEHWKITLTPVGK